MGDLGCVRCTKRAACPVLQMGLDCKPGPLSSTISNGKAIGTIGKQATATWRTDKHLDGYQSTYPWAAEQPGTSTGSVALPLTLYRDPPRAKNGTGDSLVFPCCSTAMAG